MAGRARLARLVWSAMAPLTLTSLHRPFGVGPILSFITFFLSSCLLGKNAIHLGADNSGGERFVIEDHAQKGRGAAAPDVFCIAASAARTGIKSCHFVTAICFTWLATHRAGMAEAHPRRGGVACNRWGVPPCVPSQWLRAGPRRRWHQQRQVHRRQRRQ